LLASSCGCFRLGFAGKSNASNRLALPCAAHDADGAGLPDASDCTQDLAPILGVEAVDAFDLAFALAAAGVDADGDILPRTAPELPRP